MVIDDMHSPSRFPPENDDNIMSHQHHVTSMSYCGSHGKDLGKRKCDVVCTLSQKTCAHQCNPMPCTTDIAPTRFCSWALRHSFYLHPHHLVIFSLSLVQFLVPGDYDNELVRAALDVHVLRSHFSGTAISRWGVFRPSTPSFPAITKCNSNCLCAIIHVRALSRLQQYFHPIGRFLLSVWVKPRHFLVISMEPVSQIVTFRCIFHAHLRRCLGTFTRAKDFGRPLVTSPYDSIQHVTKTHSLYDNNM